MQSAHSTCPLPDFPVRDKSSPTKRVVGGTVLRASSLGGSSSPSRPRLPTRSPPPPCPPAALDELPGVCIPWHLNELLHRRVETKRTAYTLKKCCAKINFKCDAANCVLHAPHPPLCMPCTLAEHSHRRIHAPYPFVSCRGVGPTPRRPRAVVHLRLCSVRRAVQAQRDKPRCQPSKG